MTVYNTGLYFVSQMTKLREAGIPVYIIAGNHDAASKMTKTLRLPDKVFLFPTDKPGTVHLEDLGVAIYGQDFSFCRVRAGDEEILAYAHGEGRVLPLPLPILGIQSNS